MLNLNLMAKVTLHAEEGKGDEEILQTLSYEFTQEDIEECLSYYRYFSENKIVRLIVAGGRCFNDRELFNITLNHLLRYFKKNNQPVIIVSGGANGADTFAREFAHENNLPFKEFIPDWDVNGKQAGFIRNTEMADYGTHLVAFSKGTSGTEHMISAARNKKLGIKVVKYG